VDVLADVFLQHRVAHPPLYFAGIEFFLFEVETVFAVEIANRSDRFRQQMKRVSGVGDGRLAHARKGRFNFHRWQMPLYLRKAGLFIQPSALRAAFLASLKVGERELNVEKQVPNAHGVPGWQRRHRPVNGAECFGLDGGPPPV
jgi:hypothetical protein